MRDDGELPEQSPLAGSHKIFWGDLHCHTGFSGDWKGADPNFGPDQFFNVARSRHLDFCAITDHAENLSDEQWSKTVQAAQAAEALGFVPILGYEVSAAGTFQAENVLFRRLSGTEPFVFAHLSMAGNTRPDSHCLSFEQIWSTLETRAVGQLIVTRADQIVPPESFTQIERAALRLVEACSTNRGYRDTANGGSNAENTVAYLRAGLVGVSNSHGNGDDGGPIEPGPGFGALTAIVAPRGRLTRGSLFNALEARRTYAVVNRWPGRSEDGSERIQLSFHASTDSGEIVFMGEDRVISANAQGRAGVTLNLMANRDTTSIGGASILVYRDGEFQKDAREEWNEGKQVFSWSADEIQRGETWAFVGRLFLKATPPNSEFTDGGWPGQYVAAFSSPIWITVD